MLTTSQIKRVKTPSKLTRHLDADGLYLEVSPKGSKSWRYRYKNYDGKWTMKSLGQFPLVSLEEARELRDDLKNLAQYKAVPFELAACEWLEYKDYASSKNKQLVKCVFS
jgi:hypothetical protein